MSGADFVAAFSEKPTKGHEKSIRILQPLSKFLKVHLAVNHLLYSSGTLNLQRNIKLKYTNVAEQNRVLVSA